MVVAEPDRLFPLGRYGDTHVPPAVLFDVDDPVAGPPPDAIDVQFRCPVSLSVLLDGLAQAGLTSDLTAWRRAYSDLVTDTMTRLQADAGRVADRAQSGSAPARLELAAVVETAVPGFAQARWHAHIYIGATAESLMDGTRWPVDRWSLNQSVPGVTEGFYANRLEELASRELDVDEWGEPRPGAVKEIMRPPWHEYIGSAERGVCPGPWGPRRKLLLADARHLQSAAEMERQLAYEREHGLEYRPPTWQESAAEFQRRYFAGELRQEH